MGRRRSASTGSASGTGPGTRVPATPSTRTSEREGDAMAKKSNAVAEELRVLADDLKDLFETLTSDPKERARKERRWRVLYGVASAVFALAARRVATKAWAVLTGE